MKRARSARLALLLTALLVFAGSAGAAQIEVLTPVFTLEEVMAMADGLRVGDKVFSDWSYTDSSQNGGLAPAPGAITVEGVRVLYPGQTDWEYGMRFTGNWSAFGKQLADTVLRYKITADDPWWIVDNTLWLSVGGAADAGQATISETVYKQYPPADDSDLVARKYVYMYEGKNHILEHIDFGGRYKELWVVKDVGVNGGNDPPEDPIGSAHVSEFYQTFSQIPEPGTLMLLGAGTLLLLRRRRR